MGVYDIKIKRLTLLLLPTALRKPLVAALMQSAVQGCNAIYGSFAALPLFLLWMQISWQILLFGGELSFAYQNRKRFDEERESLLANYDCRRKLMVAVMTLVVRAFRDGRGAVPLAEIREELELPSRILSNILFTLVGAGMLNEIRRDGKEFEPEYAPARDISTLRVYDVLEAVDSRGAERETAEMRRKCDTRGCADIVDRLKEDVRRSPNNVKITELIDDEPQ